MTVEDTIRQSIANFPCLHNNRTEVLHHVFCVLGNGYHWVDGALELKFPLEEDHSPFWDEPAGDDILTQVQRQVAQAQNAQSRVILAELDDRCRLQEPLPDCYPLYEYAKLLTLPEDIQSDWLEAAQEILTAIEGVPSYSQDNRPWILKARTLIEQRRHDKLR